MHSWGWEYVENEYGDFGHIPYPREYTEIPEPVYDYDYPIGPMPLCSHCGKSHLVDDQLIVWCEDVTNANNN